MKPKGFVRALSATPLYVLSGGLAIVFLFPLVWAAVASVSPLPGSPQAVGFGLNDYAHLMSYADGLPQYLYNSVFVACATVVVTLAVSLPGGYAFAKFDFPGKNVLFLVTLAILMVPYATMLIPLYVLLKFLDVSNSLPGLALVMAMFQLPFATFMMRISFEAIPKELEEAALVDGCGTFGVFRKILLPSARPGIITVALFAFLAAWNDFITPLILISDSSKEPLSLAIATLRQQAMGVIDYGSLEAGVVVMAVPCIILFLALQGQYVRGFMSGAIKG